MMKFTGIIQSFENAPVGTPAHSKVVLRVTDAINNFHGIFKLSLDAQAVRKFSLGDTFEITIDIKKERK